MSFAERVHAPAEDRDRRAVGLSLGGLIAGNLLLIASYAAGWVELGEVLWTYWLQSVLIGAFNFRRMWKLERFTTEGLTSNGRPVPETREAKRSTARFFLLHYGAFHAAYALFLTTEHRPTAAWLWLLPAGAGLLLAEWSAYARHRRSDPLWTPNLGTLLFQPYLRIIPMHLAILTAGAAGAVFLLLKLGADVGMYLVDERLDAQRARAQGVTAGEAAVKQAG
jgi:hypothetical protein